MLKRGLIVDDAAFTRMVLRGILEKNGYEVAGEASNGIEALELYEKECPDFVTLAITMPVMDGLETLNAIMGKYPHATVFMCSAIDQHSIILEAVKMGAKDFIIKPFKPESVVETLAKFV